MYVEIDNTHYEFTQPFFRIGQKVKIPVEEALIIGIRFHPVCNHWQYFVSYSPSKESLESFFGVCGEKELRQWNP